MIYHKEPTKVRYLKKYEKDKIWLKNKSWSIPHQDLHPVNDQQRRESRKPLSEELELLRTRHMRELHEEGASYSLIGQLYGLDRSVVYNILNKK